MKTCPECYTEYEDAVEVCPSDQSPLTSMGKDPLVGSRLANRYEIVSVIGRGGMGVVYKARQEQMDRYMAIKMLHSHKVAEPEAVKRFYREAKTVSQVKHHHIITLYDFGMTGQGQPYLVMDYLEGTSLKDIIKANGPLPFDRTEHIYRQVIEALVSAHAHDVVHRDLKPENIMLSIRGGEKDWVTLVDFGLSKLKDTGGADNIQITRVGDVCGSPPYMSPEQCLSSQVVDPRSDIYSLAVCIYETLSGKLPFNAKSAIEMLDCHLYAKPIPFNESIQELRLCTELARVLNKALEKEPGRRHQFIDEFGEEFYEAMKRDALKVRTQKHREQASTYEDLLVDEYEEEPLPGEHRMSLDGVQFFGADELNRNQAQSGRYGMRSQASSGRYGKASQTTSGKYGKASQSNSGKYGKASQATSGKYGNAKGAAAQSSSTPLAEYADDMNYEEQAPTLLEKVQYFFLKLIGREPQPEEDIEEYPLDSCPHCGAPVQPRIKFCMNCQRQLVSPQKLTSLRASQGVYSLPRQHRGSSEHVPKLSQRSKQRMSRSGLPLWQQALIIGLVGYGIYAGMQNKAVMKEVQHAISTIKASTK